jgi:hypothetical protein
MLSSTQFHKYEVHERFGHLKAPSGRLARLQLAALHAATGSLLPEPDSQATGGQTAMQLLRESWSTQPMTQEELQQLQSASRLGGYLAPGLAMLACDLEASSCMLQHLYTDGCSSTAVKVAAVEDGVQELDVDAANSYRLQAKKALPGGFSLHPNLQLTAAEEQWLLGTSRGTSSNATSTLPAWRRFSSLYNAIGQLPTFPVDAAFVEETEMQLEQLVIPATKPAVIPPYPLICKEQVPLEKQMHEELKASWEHHKLNPEPTETVANVQDRMQDIKVKIVCCQLSPTQFGTDIYNHRNSTAWLKHPLGANK